MTQSFDDFYWKRFDVKNKDTSLVERFGRDVWDHRQAEVDELKKRIDEALSIIYTEKAKAETSVYYSVDSDLIFGIGYDLHEVLKGNQDGK